MNVSIRRKLDMAQRVRDFCRTRPSQSPGYTAAVERLTERLARAEALAKQEVAGKLAVSGAVASKEQLRQEIDATVALLAGLARSAASEEAELKTAIGRPGRRLNHQAFLTRARVAADTAATHQELLIRYGMDQNFIAELNAALDRFEKVLNEKHAGRAAHVGARAELGAVTAECMLIVQQLDALNRFHFRKDAESLAGWKSARDVAWPLSPPMGQPQKPAA
jgi:hypothetical protein